MNYIEVTFDITPYEEAVADALISELGTIGWFLLHRPGIHGLHSCQRL